MPDVIIYCEVHGDLWKHPNAEMKMTTPDASKWVPLRQDVRTPSMDDRVGCPLCLPGDTALLFRQEP